MAAAAAASTERSALDALMAFNDECSRHDLTQVNTELKEFAAEVLDALYAEFVLKVGREADGRAVTPMQYAEDRLGVGGGVDIPLSGIQGNYTTRLGDMLRFQEVLRLPSFGMIPPEYTQKKVPNHMQDSAKHRMDKIVDGLFSMYSVVFHTRKLSEGRSVSHPVPLCEMYAKHPNIEIGEPDEAHTDQHKLILYALHRLAEMRARRFDEWVMVPKTTSTGYNSTAYERKMRIDQFLAEECTKERNYPMWLVLTSGERVGNWTTRILREHKNLEFPDLVRSRTKFAFNDGVYLADEDVFRPYGDADRRKLTVPHLQSMTVEQREQLNQIHEDQESASRYMQWSFGTASDSDTPAAQSRRPTIAQQLHAQRRNILLGEEMIGEAAAAVYHDMDFNPGVYETAMDVPTPNCDKIWETQELPDEVKRWVYALIGRMLYNVGELDDWQISPFFKGVAGTGKSTILRLIRMFYESQDVGVMSNNIEAKFGLAALYDKLIVICFELRRDFGLNQAELQSLMSGEPMAIAQKYKTALTDVEWRAPFAAAGNMTADWGDGSGAMARRWAVIEFKNAVLKGDPNLMANLKKELPKILLKANRAYIEVLSECGNVGPFDTDDAGRAKCLPKYFHEQKQQLERNMNSLLNFVTASGVMVRPKEMNDPDGDPSYYVEWNQFVELYGKYCRQNNTRAMPMMSSDSYLTTFKELGLEKVQQLKKDPLSGDDEVMAYWVIGCKLSNRVLDEALREQNGEN